MRQPSLLSAVLLLVSVRGLAAQQRSPVDSVAPNIGSIGQLLSATLPFVQVPYGQDLWLFTGRRNVHGLNR